MFSSPSNISNDFEAVHPTHNSQEAVLVFHWCLPWCPRNSQKNPQSFALV